MSEATETTAAVAATEQRRTDLAIGAKGLQLNGLADLYRFAGFIAKTPGFAPKGMESAESVCVAIQFGYELGLSPMQALQSIAVINGRPGIFGDAAKALIESSGLMEKYEQWYELDGKKLVTAEGYTRTPFTSELTDNLLCCVMSKRTGRDPLVSTFSVGDAKAAGLWKKQGPWTQYPARMLMFRARGFGLRDNFGDVLKGLRTDDEIADLPALVEATPSTAASTVEGLRNRLADMAPTIRETAAEIISTNGHANGKHAESVTETPKSEPKPETKEPAKPDQLTELLARYGQKEPGYDSLFAAFPEIKTEDDILGAKKVLRARVMDWLTANLRNQQTLVDA